jgi:Skp family chaperone for outer membrane proteins
MTRRLFVLLTAVGLLTALVILRRSAADDEKKPLPVSRMAFLNFNYVVKNYQKYIAFTAQMKKDMAWYEDKAKGKKATLESLAKELQKPDLQAPVREKLEKDIIQAQRELEDIGNDGKRYLGQKSDEQLVQLYREVQEVAQRYAIAHGFDAVLHYNDAPAPNYYSAASVARKMPAGALKPLHVHPSLDISAQIVQALNAAYKPEGHE